MPNFQKEPTDRAFHPSAKYWSLGVLLVIMVLGYFFLTMQSPGESTFTTAPTISESIRTGEVPRPPLTPSATIKSREKTKGFQALISYTDRGFEPARITVKQGDSVRFTNNSSHVLRVAVASSELAAEDTCAPDTFDSCEQLLSQDFWEFTFTNSGEVRFVNTLDAWKSGTIWVE